MIAALRSHGLWGKNVCHGTSATSSAATAGNPEGKLGQRRAAQAIWQRTQPARGTVVQAYLASRGLVLPPTSTIRFHPHLKHVDGRHWPAMVAVVADGLTGTAIGIHRTFLKDDGSGKALVSNSKMMLGPCRGGAVRLGNAGTNVMVAEGIETALAAMNTTGKPAWAALSTSGLRSLELPAEITDITILADADNAGEAAAEACACRLQCQGRRVRVARPPPGQDFNDMLLADVNHSQEDLPNDR